MQNPEENPWKTLDAEVMYESAWIKITKSNVLNPANKPALYSWVHFKNLAIGIVPMDKEKNIWLVGQFRYPVNEYSWEIPEGGGKIGVLPEESAKRELLEETGIEAAKLTELMRMHLSNSATDEMSITYLATDLAFKEAEPEESEALQVKKVSLNTAFDMVLKGEIMDAITVAAIQRLKWMDEKGALDAFL
ncbi:MAG: NUDIX hydrolase [Bacteroidia bacterium]|nr:NUDIX hydrolase [Bacteroidia bacterium]